MDFISYMLTQEPVLSLTGTQKTAMLNDYCSYFNYQTTITDSNGDPIPNPESKTEFANRMIGRDIKSKINATRKIAAEAAATYEEFEIEA